MELAPAAAEIRAAGSTALRAIAGELNARGIRTRRGGQWHLSDVRNLLARWRKKIVY
ncbi:recombinase family protein [Palleronia abyssalis]|uniref:recombinase family protein n=1 Tax=Palleronia abyssalis TaxID=1501240 RepID=UPI00351FD5BB